ncbi:MAG: exodeoxyribonuclease VII large subunit [Planctomycetes bacterium]|nr:exodeoxyribonuclease VII large subunit [Planctomycetota bacterium]
MSELIPQKGDRLHPLTISQLTAKIKGTLESRFANVRVVGEISQFTRASSGHVYLTLKDENAVLRTVLWRPVAASLQFELAEGLEVIVRGDVEVYAPRGSYQLIARSMAPVGAGALRLAFQLLTEKLKKEGLFRLEHKKPLPLFPRKIGVVTSPTGAAVRDIINVIRRRYPPVELYVYPCAVQGKDAAPQIAAAVERLNRQRPDLDLIIVGRGGGSLEDLWAFNEEVVARAIFESRIPIVSAVGHQVDFSISDFVADVRAATPTEAGEIVAPDGAELLRRVRQLARRMGLSLGNAVEAARRRLEAMVTRPAFRKPGAALLQRAQRADDALEKMKSLMARRLDSSRERCATARHRLQALGPLGVLERGYSLTLGPDGSILRSVEGAHEGDAITTRLRDGSLRSSVLDVKANPPDGA